MQTSSYEYLYDSCKSHAYYLPLSLMFVRVSCGCVEKVCIFCYYCVRVCCPQQRILKEISSPFIHDVSKLFCRFNESS